MKMLVIGITGGIGAGKSEVLKYLEERYGARLIRLDDLGREPLMRGGSCVEGAVDLLGKEILLPDGSVDRAKVASLIFGNEALRIGLDNLIHPEVKRRTLEILSEEREKGTRICVIEAALLIEEHYDAICDEMWYIYADESTRYRRLKDSRGYDDQRILSTMQRQLSEESFRAHTDFTVDNSGDFELTKKQIDVRIESLLA